MDVFCVCQKMIAQSVKRFLHWVKWINRAGEDGVLDQRMKRFGQLTGRAVVDVEQFAFRLQSRHGHSVFGQRSGFVGAQHRGCAQRFDGVDATRQHFFFRQSPRTQRREDRHHDGILLRQQRHRQRDTCENCLQPVATNEAINRNQREAQAECEQRKIAHQYCRLFLQGRALCFERTQRAADATNRAAWSRCSDARGGLPLNNQGAGVDKGNVVATGLCGRYHFICGDDFAHRCGLTRKQRLICLQAVDFKQHAVRRNAIPFGQQHDVAFDNVLARNANRLAVANHARLRAGQIAQRLHRALGLAFLVKRQREHDQHSAKQRDALERLTEHKVECSSGKQQQKHRLAGCFPDDVQQRSTTPAGDRVGARFCES